MLQRYEELYWQAHAQGLENELQDAGKIIAESLRSKPSEFGDPQFDYHFMKATSFIRIVAPLVVSYAVHNELDIVFVKSIEKLRNAGF